MSPPPDASLWHANIGRKLDQSWPHVDDGIVAHWRLSRNILHHCTIQNQSGDVKIFRSVSKLIGLLRLTDQNGMLLLWRMCCMENRRRG